MRRGAAFVEILEEKLADFSTVESRPAPPAGFRATPVLGFFLFDTAGPSDVPRVECLGSYTSAQIQRPTPFHPVSSSRAVSRSRRTLPARQQRALERLVALGASLEADFSPEELRSAFRSLARQYHPDRHPGTSDAEKKRLALTFAELHDAYTNLQVVSAAA
jgi:hypothetical protein